MLFLVILFLIKTGFLSKNPFSQNKQEGLIYNNVAIGDLINKDTDGDGISNWEEALYGLDPTKKETTPGILDSTTINKLKAEQGLSTTTTNGYNQGPENLTETDKFSRELFSTVAALNQNGDMDQATADKISSSLADHIQNSVPRKVFITSDIKVINNDLYQNTKNYADNLNNIFKNYQIDYSVIDVLQKFIIDDNNVDVNALPQLDPIIEKIAAMINGVIKLSVPETLAPLHLDFLNGLERILENVKDIRLYDSDIVVALGGISKYNQNTTTLQSAVKNLSDAINQKLNN